MDGCEADRTKKLGKEQLKFFFCSFSFLCNVHFYVVCVFFNCVFIFVCLFISETPFHFTLPKEGDIIPPLTGATPPLIGHLKLEPKRHSTPIGE